jgi:hypothetical protein
MNILHSIRIETIKVIFQIELILKSTLMLEKHTTTQGGKSGSRDPPGSIGIHWDPLGSMGSIGIHRDPSGSIGIH